MKDLTIIQWEICPKNGLSVSYNLNGINDYFNAPVWRFTTLLSNENLIQERKIVDGKIMVRVADMWVSLKMYIDTCVLSLAEIKLLTIEHLETKAISNATETLFFFKEPCLN